VWKLATLNWLRVLELVPWLVVQAMLVPWVAVQAMLGTSLVVQVLPFPCTLVWPMLDIIVSTWALLPVGVQELTLVKGLEGGTSRTWPMNWSP